MAKKTTKKKAGKKNSTKKRALPKQKNLETDDGAEIQPHERFDDVDEMAEEYFEAKDAKDEQEEIRKEKRKEIHDRLNDLEFEDNYFVYHGTKKFRIKAKKSNTLSIVEVKEKEAESA